MGWTEEKNNTAFLHRAAAKPEKLKLVHSITEMGEPPELLCPTLDAVFIIIIIIIIIIGKKDHSTV